MLVLVDKLYLKKKIIKKLKNRKIYLGLKRKNNGRFSNGLRIP